VAASAYLDAPMIVETDFLGVEWHSLYVLREGHANRLS
jgi:hypothetical protein